MIFRLERAKLRVATVPSKAFHQRTNRWELAKLRLKMIRCLVAAILFASIAESAIAEGAFDRSPPGINIPEKLQPYLDEAKIRSSFNGLVLMLQTAKFKDNSFEISGVVDNRYLKGECNTEEFQHFYRGIQLAQFSYNLFLSKVEKGWFSADRALPETVFGPPAFSSYGRETLLLYLTNKRLFSIMEIAKTFANLPSDLKDDLRSFLVTLKEFRTYYDSLKLVDDEFKQLLLRAEDGYVEAPNRPTKLWAWDFAHEVRVLINKVMAPSKPPISQCYEFQDPYILEVGTDPKIEYRPIFTPVKYMILFWKRREFEGTSDLAEFMMNEAIAVLGKTGN